MAVSKNIDRYWNDETLDLDPKRVLSAFQSANSGYTKRQSRIANELIQKDPSIAQSWGVRVAAISSAKWEIVGGNAEHVEWVRKSLTKIQPSTQSGLDSFYELLEYLQSAVMQGFALSAIDWEEGRSAIRGFKTYAQSLFSYQDSDLPYFVGQNDVGQTTQAKVYPRYPEWIYHTANGSRQTEPLRAGLVRPLAYLYCFSRTITIEYLRGLEKYGLPTPAVSVDSTMYDDANEEKQALKDFWESMTYDGFILYDKEKMEVEFPTAGVFNADDFKVFLERNEKQIFRLILGQDSTSSADNSNRSTAAVHNLVRGDILASDARAIEETVNNQIIKPLFEGNYGSEADRPVFRFRLKSTAELKEMAEIVKLLSESGYEISDEDLNSRLGMRVIKREDAETETEAVTDGND
tara:strand:- start:5607 stop:6827 length:1221 start_codon:yes stop_codon:yes gene_type:complete